MQTGRQRCRTGAERSLQKLPIRPFTSSTACRPKLPKSHEGPGVSRQNPPRLVLSAAKSSWLQWTCSNLPSSLHKLFATAVSLRRLVFSPSDNQQCFVSYADGSSSFRPMSDAARLAFAALEQDDDTPIAGDATVDIEALCLLSYSEQEHKLGSGKASLQPVAPAALAACTWLSDVMVSHSVMSSDSAAKMRAARSEQQWGNGSDDGFDAMSTLCIVTYSEDDH